MNKKYLNNTIKVCITLNERDIIQEYTSTPLIVIKKIDTFIENPIIKRKNIKRVSVIFLVKELDSLISSIATRANQHNTLPEIQYTLDSLFGKLATKYNHNIL